MRAQPPQKKRERGFGTKGSRTGLDRIGQDWTGLVCLCLSLHPLITKTHQNQRRATFYYRVVKLSANRIKPRSVHLRSNLRYSSRSGGCANASDGGEYLSTPPVCHGIADVLLPQAGHALRPAINASTMSICSSVRPVRASST